MTIMTQQIQKKFSKAAFTYDDAAQFQQATAKNLFDRLDFLNIDPKVILDLGTGTGYALKGLQHRYPKAAVWGVDFAYDMVKYAQEKFSLATGITADAHYLPFADRSVDVIFSNLLIQWSDDITQLFKECRRVLRPGGVFLFSTLGPDTLKELRQAWAAVDHHEHVNNFADMHDVGDALLAACLLAPVMDRSEEVQHYKTVHDILKMLKNIGASNNTENGYKGLMTKKRLNAMINAYEKVDDMYLVTYEVLYGIAWGPKLR
ncbi:MAG: malonyl-ACP O-methyltransferase BioC [Gammaproteobacteria bacterium]